MFHKNKRKNFCDILVLFGGQRCCFFWVFEKKGKKKPLFLCKTKKRSFFEKKTHGHQKKTKTKAKFSNFVLLKKQKKRMSRSKSPQWDCIPEARLKDHLRFYKTTRKEHTAPHWTRDIMITTLHSFYCRSSGMVPLSVAELDFFWTTGNIPTRNLHLLQPQSFITSEQLRHNRCALCTRPFVKDDMVYQLPCGDRFHVTHDPIYHTDNIKNLLRNDNQCPCCCARVVLSDNNG